MRRCWSYFELQQRLFKSSMSEAGQRFVQSSSQFSSCGLFLPKTG